MADRRVTGSGKDRNGDIITVCGPWGGVNKATAIADIERRLHTYFVQDRLFRRADVHVAHGPRGKYLRSDPNSVCSDNLDNLPAC